MFSPVGPGGCSIKICPPLCITADAVCEGVSVIAEATEAAIKSI
jgi:diaminobutyrate-pyruvate transaminase/4-aminobutyrate aminotransferase/(S)-3-amino-2-methylpropionate transaminase